jgi:thioredoxin 1
MAIIELTDENFDKEVLKADLPVLVDFWAPWCGPCQMTEPVIEELAGELEGKIKIAKLNVDENSQTAQKFEVMSIPTVVIFKGGKEAGRRVGFEGKEGYKKLLEEVLI